MKTFHVASGPYMRNHDGTNRIMQRLLFSLLPIILFSFYKNGIMPFIHHKATLYGMFYPLIFIFISTLTTFLTELICSYILFHHDKDKLKSYIKTSYSIFPGLFLGLILPINTPLSILVVGSMFATIVGKMVFGGFGKNVFNPALVGRLFVISSYAMVIGSLGGYANPMELDAVTTATPLTNVGLVDGIGSYEALVMPYGSLWNFFLGTIPGAIGETSAMLCIIAFLYLTITKTIKWRIPTSYIITVFVMTFIIGSMNGQGIWYPLFQILSGGLMFGAVFMATDPVTSPTTEIGSWIYGICLGLLTVMFRYLTPYPEGVLTSILTMNMFVFLIDKIGSRSKLRIQKITPYAILLPIVILMMSITIGFSYQKEEAEVDPNYTIISRSLDGTKTVYQVKQKGFSGDLIGKIVIEDKNIISLEILEQHDSYYQKVIDADYLETLVKSGNQVADVDTVSGATITSTALKKMVQNTLIDYDKNGNVEWNKPEEKPGEETKPTDPDYHIESKVKIENGFDYVVTEQSFGGPIKAHVMIQNGKVMALEVLEVSDSYFSKVQKAKYIDEIMNHQDRLEELDTVSGATITSTALKKMVQNTLNDAKENNNEV